MILGVAVGVAEAVSGVVVADADVPLSYEELAEGGVRRPGHAVYELQLVASGSI